MKSGENYKQTRRGFLKNIGLFSIALQLPYLATSCKEKLLNYYFKITGTNHVLGHRLWLKNFPKPTTIIETDYVIIGSGITGLSAGRQLNKRGKSNYIILELENSTGGNSNYKQNIHSKYPIAAHYLPLPNIEDKELLSFLEESDIITHFENDLPVFNENYMCYDPKERLFIKNNWQEDLIPKYSISLNTEKEINRFFSLMNEFKSSKDTLGKYHFFLPICNASSENKYHYLDEITMKEWMLNNKFTDKDLWTYIDYCCKDDFGIGIDFISAWAGIFYFAARKHNSSQSDAVLTWPEGNGKLKDLLEQFSKEKIKTQQLVYSIEKKDAFVSVYTFNSKENKSILYKAKKVICCTPQYITKYLIKEKAKFKSFEYSPWFTATITFKKDVIFNDNLPLCWDNVIHEGKGLGYIYNQHQTYNQIINHKVITFYYAFSGSDSTKERKKLYQMSEEKLKEIIFSDLTIAHPLIENDILEIDIFKIGHGMISPRPGFIFGNEKQEAKKSINQLIYFAHSDLSGISVFEEAFHQGINIVNELLNDEK